MKRKRPQASTIRPRHTAVKILLIDPCGKPRLQAAGLIHLPVGQAMGMLQPCALLTSDGYHATE